MQVISRAEFAIDLVAGADLDAHVGSKETKGRHTDLGGDMKLRDAIRLLAVNGWRMVAQKGSHRQFRHPTNPGKVTVPGKLSEDLPVGTLKSILRQAGLDT